MEKCGTSASSSSSKDMDQLVDIVNSFSLHTTTLVVQKNATDGRCQHVSRRQYVADTRENDPKACNPFQETNYQETSQILTAQLSTLQLCPSIEHGASGDATEGEGSQAPIEGEIRRTSPVEEWARVATLLNSADEGFTITTPTEVYDNGQSLKNCCRGLPHGQANVNHRKTRFSRQEFVRPGETENAKRRCPFSQNTDLISRKRLKVTVESSCPCQDKQKGVLKRSGTGPNPLVRNMYEKLAARYRRELFTPPGNNYMTQGKDQKAKEKSVKRCRDTNWQSTSWTNSKNSSQRG